VRGGLDGDHMGVSFKVAFADRRYIRAPDTEQKYNFRAFAT
jgi:hypothetical protein